MHDPALNRGLDETVSVGLRWKAESYCFAIWIANGKNLRANFVHCRSAATMCGRLQFGKEKYHVALLVGAAWSICERGLHDS
jgi:hypothetical protein